MKISFCTTCAQRLYQLTQTWEQNIEMIRKYPYVEWVLLNYDGEQKMHEFVMNNQPIWPNNFVYAKELSNREWHMSVAKNIAHQLGSGDILFNLDCDNYIGEAIDNINSCFINDVKAVHFFSGTHMDGTFGRIGIEKKLFYELGGYDESFYPMAGQDTDLLTRVQELGHRIERIKCSSNVSIKNTKEESIKLCKKYNQTWEQFAKDGRKRINKKIIEKNFIANIEKGMTKPNVEIYKAAII